MSNDRPSDDGIATSASPTAPEPDSHGQAALLLVESIIHTLIDAKVLSRVQVIGAVRTAAEVKVEVADELGESEANMRRSLGLLTAIERTLTVGEPGAANEP
ncbi:hypothetical protein [Sphingomonas bacterium]|uniref:hypothetical protein n=1 Tax=Sphingomonas bacterium TaxID=1895847 RepID=UPI0015765402|nr:hypothetical protein [Sphingomonas bacterium]